MRCLGIPGCLIALETDVETIGHNAPASEGTVAMAKLMSLRRMRPG